ncbi:uncharacterized protein LOC111051958 [Nilaparvata lugens]|uniref:uncharacterized protein LOC111051958 n=1 Tax=Nilaparvata lugens TaxID=108931 RepID=UPI00193E418B|nr:uncharacterized protein LOC111051958 [Nilaparvata lugens]
MNRVCKYFPVILIVFTGPVQTTHTPIEMTIKSEKSSGTKSCRLPSAPNTIYFQKVSASENKKQILAPNSAVRGNATVVHLECRDKVRQSTSFQGEYYMVCYDGQWFPPNNVCIKFCPALSFPNSMFKCYLKNERVSCEEKILPETRAERTCISGHIDQSKTSKNICKENGEWKHNFADCFLGHGVLANITGAIETLLKSG